MYGYYRSSSPLPPASPQIYHTSPYSITSYGPVIYQTTPIIPHWSKKWPNFRFIIVAVGLILCSWTIIALDIANVAIEGNKQSGTSKLGHSTDKVGAGIWTGFIIFISAILILISIFTQHKRITLTFTLFSVLFAFSFIIVLIGLIGNAIQTSFSTTNHTDAENIQKKLLISILSFALLSLIFCLMFFLFYIRFVFSTSIHLSNRY